MHEDPSRIERKRLDAVAGTAGPRVSPEGVESNPAGVSGPAAAAAPATPTCTLRATRALEGLMVTDSHGDHVGSIEQVVLDLAYERIAYAIVAFVGTLAYATALFPIPWEALMPCEEENRLSIDIEWRDLEGAPSFERNDWPNMSDRRWSARVHAYYGLGPYWA